jgi:hypothetical protein
MTMRFGTRRLVAFAIGLTILAAGLALMIVGAGGPASIPGWWLTSAGGLLTVGAIIERARYRSNASDRSRLPAGPGGGEPRGTALDPRFRRSDEVFDDPTSGHRMRVWADPATGERRYVAED